MAEFHHRDHHVHRPSLESVPSVFPCVVRHPHARSLSWEAHAQIDRYIATECIEERRKCVAVGGRGARVGTCLRVRIEQVGDATGKDMVLCCTALRRQVPIGFCIEIDAVETQVFGAAKEPHCRGNGHVVRGVQVAL